MKQTAYWGKIIRRMSIFCLSLLPLPLVTANAEESASEIGSTIAFGSCLRQWKDQRVWQSISAQSPRAFIFLGDNMYSDVGSYLALDEPERIEKAYEDLLATTDFKGFLASAQDKGISLYATWDDHDYGTNDGGVDYPYKLASKGYFLDFFGLEDTASGGKSSPGIYQSHRLNVAGLDAQLLLLDTRSFRSPISKNPDDETCPKTQTVPNTEPDAMVLGIDQWRWLERELRKPADLRIIASSIQVISDEHCFEKWANFPGERSRLFRLIKETQAQGVIFISGDRHLAEISKLPASITGYPVYEVTSSGLNSAMGPRGALFNEQNRFRVQPTFFDDNFGSIAIRPDNGSYLIDLEIYDSRGNLARRVTVSLNELSF